MKKILIVGLTSNFGGVERFVQNEVVALRDRASIFIVKYNNRVVANEKWFNSNGAKFVNFDYPNRYLAPFLRLRRAIEFLKEQNPDVLHIHANNLNVAFWAVAAERVGIEIVIIHSHNTQITRSNRLKFVVFSLIQPHQRRAVSRLKNVTRLAASDRAGEWMFQRDKFEVIPNAIKVESYMFNLSSRIKIRNELMIGEEQLVLLHVGRFDYQKNQKRLLPILNQLKMKTDFTMIFVGDGAEREQIQQQFKAMGINEFVRFVGVQSDVSQYMSAADVLVMPSRFEAMPYVLIESEANGLPVIGSDEGFSDIHDVTHRLQTISLNASDEEWTNLILKTLIGDYKERISDNFLVQSSNYSMTEFKKKISKLYNID